MKTLLSLLMVLVLLLSSGVMVACGGGGDDETGAATVAPTEGTPPEGTPTQEPTSDGDLDDLLANIAEKAEDIDCFHYKAEVTIPQMPTETLEFWMGEGKMKMEGSAGGSQRGIYIWDEEAGVMIMYTPDTGQAMQFPLDSSDMGIEAPENPVEDVGSLMDWGYTTQGEETINGMDCIVVKYSIMGAETTMWIWEDYGFPVKTVVDSPSGKMTTEFKEIDFDCAPDSEFKLPPGVEVMDLEDMMSGFGDFGDMGDFEMPDMSGWEMPQ